jgi:hypothetical protein
MELLAVAFVVLLLAGCFSSSDSTGGSACVDDVDEDGVTPSRTVRDCPPTASPQPDTDP